MPVRIDDLNSALKGRYQVERELGEGGTARVYLAHDLRHERKVALKVLKPQLVAVVGAGRFLAEIRTTAKLQHPHILPLFDSGEANGFLFFTMPFVEGKSLRTRIDHEGQLRVADSVGLAREIAGALEHAHRHGVVHRDIKPGNILLGGQGDPLVSDFGIALAVAEAAGGRITETGMSLGTPHYMSPEQATADRDVDHRSDIYALGCVLYEMLVGSPPFTAPTTPAVLLKILREDAPPITTIRPTVPPNVAAAVAKALEKLPANRFNSALDLVEALDDPLFRHGERSEGRWSGRRVAWVAAPVVVLLAAAAYALVAPDDSEPPVLISPTQITFSSGLEDHPAWSPDGTRLAYHGNQSGDMDIWLALAAGGEPLNITNSPATMDLWPSWSPDGSQIAYSSRRGETAGCYVISVLGGVPRRVSPGTLGRPAWSPSGEQLTCPGFDDDGPFVNIVTLSTGEARRLAVPGEHPLRYGLSWSPDGRLLAYVDSPEREAQATFLRVLRIEDGETLLITDGTTRIASLEWDATGAYLYFASSRGGSMDLWRQEMSGRGTAVGDPVQVTRGLQLRSASFSSDGSRFAYSSGRLVANVYSVPLIEAGVADWADAEQVTFDHAYAEYLDVLPDREQLAVSSDRAGNSDIWLLSTSGGAMRQVTSHPLADWDPKFSPDGSQIAFYSLRSGNRDIWTVPAAGGVQRQVTDDLSLDWQPSWSPDGARLAFISERTGIMKVWVSGSGGEEARRLTDSDDGGVWENHPQWSPDGAWILYISNRGGSLGLWRAPVEGGPAERLTSEGDLNIGDGYARWSLNGTEIYYLDVTNSMVVSLSLADRTTRSLVLLTDRRGTLGRFALAANAERLFFTWEEHLGDIWTMDVNQD